MEIIYWSDYACPFCYIGRNHLEAAIQKLKGEGDFTVTMKAFELDPDAPAIMDVSVVDFFAEKYGMSREVAEDKINGINLMGQAIGLDFHYDKAKKCNTFDAHRLTKLAQSKTPETANALSEALYKAYFTESKALSDHQVLVEAAVSVGISKEEAMKVLTSDAYAKEVREEEALAARYGIQAVPFFVVNDQVALPGALPVEEFEKVLREMLEKAKAN
ncbi:DsbA family oxidoreductase [uncultured Veillonella sp.]|uniref:DsbA family oxidoreductase n=1 Tax=uncultured Veillonella sp. TaxID=159268 RepID=UPI00262F60B0|nr:DsbA family oxidoreductase [uncultured Veillonella sp.]